MHQSCDSFCVHNLRETTFLCAVVIVNFSLCYCNWKHFMQCTIAIANNFMEYCKWNLSMGNCIWKVLYALLWFNWQYLYVPSQYISFVCTIRFETFFHLRNWQLFYTTCIDGVCIHRRTGTWFPGGAGPKIALLHQFLPW